MLKDSENGATNTDRDTGVAGEMVFPDFPARSFVFVYF